MLSAGFARVDVTPPLGNPLAGYFTARSADGILDPIELNALAISDGQNTGLVITGDFIYIMENAATPLRERIREATGIPAENIILHGLHQHTTIRLGNRTNLPMSHTVTDTAYLDVVNRKFVDVAKLAVADMKEATVSIAQKETAQPISFIRRFRMKDGSARTNPGFANPDVVGPLGDADNTVRLVKFAREGAKDIALVNFSTHPDVISGTKYSADWPGFVRRMTEADIPDVHCLLINGAQGDTNHINVSKTGLGMERYEFSRYMGRTITDVVVDIWNKTEQVDAGHIAGEVRMVYVPTNLSGQDRIEEMQQLKRDHEAGKIGSLELGLQGEMNRICELKDETLFRKVPISCLGFGKVALVGFGGEPFTQYATEARAAAPDLYVISLCCANGGQGYLPSKQAYAEGGYGVTNSRFAPDVADLVPAAVKEMLDAYQA